MPRGESGMRLKLTAHLHLVVRLRMRGDLFQVPYTHTPSLHDA
jgi:hypothetical protein